MFVDGDQVGQRSLTGAMATSSGPLRIGGDAVWGEFFKGRIDNVRVYDRALTPTDLETVMRIPA